MFYIHSYEDTCSQHDTFLAYPELLYKHRNINLFVSPLPPVCLRRCQAQTARENAISHKASAINSMGLPGTGMGGVISISFEMDHNQN